MARTRAGAIHGVIENVHSPATNIDMAHRVSLAHYIHQVKCTVVSVGLSRFLLLFGLQTTNQNQFSKEIETMC